MPTPSRRRRLARDRRAWTPKLAPTRRCGARARWPRSCSAGRSAVVLAAPFPLVLAVGLPLSRAPHLRAWRRARPRARARGRGDRRRASRSRPTRRSSGSSSCSCSRAGSSGRADAEPAWRCGSRATARSACEMRSGARAGARYRPRRRPAARPRPARARPSSSARVDRREPLRVYPRAEPLLDAPAPARDAGLRRQPGRADEGRRDRVRRHPAVRAGRPHAADQLARERRGAASCG